MSSAIDSDATAAPRRTWSERVLQAPVVLCLFLIYLLFFFGSHEGVTDPDIWWHLRNASLLVSTHHMIHVDTMSYTVAGKPWVNFEWLAELPYYFAYTWLGDSGLYLVMMLVSSAIAAGIYTLALLRSRDSLAAFMASFVAIVCAEVSLGPRTLLFGWLCLVLELAILWKLQNGRDHTVWLPVLFLVWINLHGSWFLGLGLMLLHFACGFVGGEWGNLYAARWSPAQARKLAAVSVACVAALFVNPYGWRLVVYPLDALVHDKVGTQYITEWASLDFHTALGKAVLAAMIGMGMLQLIRRQRWSLQDCVLIFVGIWGAFAYVRFVFLFGVLVAPLLAPLLRMPAPGQPKSNRNGRLLSALAIAALLALIVTGYPKAKQLHAGIASSFPEKALPYVRSLAGKGRLLNEYRWGGYLEWEAPKVKTFIDSRSDIFVQNGIMADYASVVHVEDTLGVLDRYDIRYVLLPEKNPAAYVLAHNAAWKKTYDDGQAVGFERVDRTTNR